MDSGPSGMARGSMHWIWTAYRFNMISIVYIMLSLDNFVFN